MGGEGGGAAGEEPGGHEEEEKDGCGPEEELHRQRGGDGLVRVGIGADGKTEDEGAEEADCGSQGQFCEEEEETILPVGAEDKKGAEGSPIEGEEAGEEGGGFG